ncbi:MAG: DUF4307 domain-containing protein [Actinomycetota bacterium]|nr:DUF4307 domain-containing protein [Actinomycetota bacterium]
MSDLMTQRYGGPRPVRRAVTIAAAAAVVLASLGWLGWAVWGQSTPDVQSSLTSYEILDGHSARATVDLSLRSPAMPGRCVLQAVAADHELVGELDFALPHDGHKRLSTTQTMRTLRRAVSVSLVGCTTARQHRPR